MVLGCVLRVISQVPFGIYTTHTASFDPLLLYLLTFPRRTTFYSCQLCSANEIVPTVPTVAAINGHCFAGAALLSLACDYRVMTDGAKRNTWMCMNEVDFGAPWPVSFAALVRAKVSATVTHKFAVEGHRFTPPEARESGLVDEIVAGGTRGVLKRAQEIAQEKAPKARAGVWGVIKVRLPF